MAIYFFYVLLLALLIYSIFVRKGLNCHVVEGDSEVEVDEVEGSKELFTGITLNDFDQKLLADHMKDSPPFNIIALFVVSDPGFEGLNLKLLHPRGGYLDSDVLVEGDW